MELRFKPKLVFFSLHQEPPEDLLSTQPNTIRVRDSAFRVDQATRTGFLRKGGLKESEDLDENRGYTMVF